MFPDLKNKRALVVGPSPFRAAVVEALEEAGANVSATDTVTDSDRQPVDILITVPQPVFARPLVDVSDEVFERKLSQTVTPVFKAVRSIAPQMQEQKWGRIIHVVWGHAVAAMRNVSVESAASAAVNQFGRAIGIEYARTGVTVNVIALGWFMDWDPANPAALEKYIPLRRFGNADDLGALLVYLASDQASYVTAQTHMLDGGLRSRG